MRALFLCERSGETARPWAEAGYECHCYDLENDNRREGNIWYRKADLTIPPIFADGGWAFACAMPPCTDLAGSGARWFKQKGLRAFIDALTFVENCKRILVNSNAPYFIENPVGRLSSWRKPDYTFHPYEYGGYPGGEDDGYTKKTCLWTGGGFVMPEKREIALAHDHNRIHWATPGPERAQFRSKTPAGFARAVFEANARVIA